jgi:DNA-binding protein H-NS
MTFGAGLTLHPPCGSIRGKDRNIVLDCSGVIRLKVVHAAFAGFYRFATFLPRNRKADGNPLRLFPIICDFETFLALYFPLRIVYHDHRVFLRPPIESLTPPHRLHMQPSTTRKSDMAKIDVDSMTLKQLMDLETRVQKAMALAKDREKAEIHQKMRALAEGAGFSMDDFVSSRRGGARVKASGAKFVNPDNRSETWTGRGRKPNWLVARLAKGAKMEDFAI